MKDNPMIESKKKTNHWQRYFLFALVGAGMLGTVFGAGFFVGRWSTRTNSPFASPLGQRIIPSSRHGAVGKVLQIEGTTITLQSRDGTSHTILTDSQTRFERGIAKATKLTLRDLKIGDQVIIVGTPNAQGQIKAKLIRVLQVPTLTSTPSGL